MNAAWSASVSGNPVLDATAPTCRDKAMKICFKGLPGKDLRQMASQAAGRGCCILNNIAGAAGGRVAGRRGTNACSHCRGQLPGSPWRGTAPCAAVALCVCCVCLHRVPVGPTACAHSSILLSSCSVISLICPRGKLAAHLFSDRAHARGAEVHPALSGPVIHGAAERGGGKVGCVGAPCSSVESVLRTLDPLPQQLSCNASSRHRASVLPVNTARGKIRSDQTSIRSNE